MKPLPSKIDSEVSQQILFGAPLMFCQTKTREQASVRYLLRIVEYEKNFKARRWLSSDYE